MNDRYARGIIYIYVAFWGYIIYTANSAIRLFNMEITTFMNPFALFYYMCRYARTCAILYMFADYPVQRFDAVISVTPMLSTRHHSRIRYSLRKIVYSLDTSPYGISSMISFRPRISLHMIHLFRMFSRTCTIYFDTCTSWHASCNDICIRRSKDRCKEW
jgi:hypothetical protein